MPAVQLWPLIKIPEFGNIWNQLSPLCRPGSSAATWIAAIPTAIVVYIIAFGDFVTSEELLRSADEVRQDEKIDFNANRSNVISGIRNVAMALCCPYTQTCGPLWAAVTAAVSQRYKEGPKAMESIYPCRYLPLVYLYLRGPDPHLLPATARAARSPVPDPDRAGLHLHPAGHEHVPHRHRAGICGVMGAVLAIQGAAWGLAVGLILFFMLFEGKRRPPSRWPSVLTTRRTSSSIEF